MWPCFNIFSTYPHPKTITKKKHTHWKTLPYPLMVWKILNPFVGAGMVGFHLLFWLDFLNFETLKSGTIIHFDLRIIVQMGWFKTTSVALFFIVGCGFFLFYFLSICGRWVTWTMLKHLILIEDTQAPMVGNCWVVFLAEVLNIIFWVLSFLKGQGCGFQKDGMVVFKKKIREKVWEKKMKKTNAWMS